MGALEGLGDGGAVLGVGGGDGVQEQVIAVTAQRCPRPVALAGQVLLCPSLKVRIPSQLVGGGHGHVGAVDAGLVHQGVLAPSVTGDPLDF